MKPDYIFRADMLDILFENRNKEYGAYELRAGYDHRLKASLGLIVALLVLATTAGYWKNHFFPQPPQRAAASPVMDSLNLTPVNLHPDPPAPARIQTKTATLKDVTMRITRDNLVDSTPIPTQEEKELKNIGTQNITGELPGESGPQGASFGSAAERPAEETTAPARAEEILDGSEIMPEFPGGPGGLQHFLSRNLRTPQDEMEPGSRIRVLVRFVVNRDGSIGGFELEQHGGPDFDNEVLRVMKKMPAWKPGTQHGRPVAVYFKLPVVFQSGDEN